MIKPAEHFTLTPQINERLLNVAGDLDCNLREIEHLCHVTIHNRGHEFFIFGSTQQSNVVRKLIEHFYSNVNNAPFTINDYRQYLVSTTTASFTTSSTASTHKSKPKKIDASHPEVVMVPQKSISIRTPNQKKYVADINNNDLTFGIGPAGTGKTYLAVCLAVNYLMSHRINKVILVRPAVEAGEKLGFLPGNLNEKVDPFLRPLFDALSDTLGADKLAELIQNDVIEIVPLAYMRGRTLNEAFIILDEAQNTTKEQMKMFLTRLGENSKMVITGDESQLDVPDSRSGLRHAISVISPLIENEKVSIVTFSYSDVMRHPLVKKLLQAYENHNK